MTRLMTTKVKLKVKNRYGINRPRPRYRHKHTKYKMYLSMMYLMVEPLVHSDFLSVVTLNM